jgi:hypothetical protein
MRLALLFIFACGAGCKQSVSTAPVNLTPSQGKAVVEKTSFVTGGEILVSGSFEIDQVGRKKMPVVVKVRRGDGTIMTSKAGNADVSGTSATFEIRLKAPVKPGHYKLVASTGEHEISASEVSVTER